MCRSEDLSLTSPSKNRPEPCRINRGTHSVLKINIPAVFNKRLCFISE